MGSADGKKGKRPPMRSSIACQNCRKSKVKCDNDGKAVTPCDTCIKQGKECVYPDATPMPPKRVDPPTIIRREAEGGSERKRLKKLDERGQLDTPEAASSYASDILSASYLTESLWTQIFDIYKLHFATELSFLHIPTLKDRMGSRSKSPDADSATLDTNLLLLGVLTLTARFHTDLVKYVVHTTSNQGGSAKSRPVQSRPDSSYASEYFAESLTKALGPLRTSMTVASIERVQAFLMLGLYEWSQARPRTGGLGAWMYVGVAIRMAQALGLGFGDRQPRHDRPGRRSLGQTSTGLPSADMTIEKEIRRRTMFSCLVLDRMLACGKERVSTIRSEDLQIQLPCPEFAFDLSQEVTTAFLKTPLGEKAPPPNVQTDSVLARFIRLVDIWGEISKWSFAGGRHVESKAPWEDGSNFRRLREELDDFYSGLPATFRLSKGNYHRHENHQASSVFVALHMLGSVCQIMLHREYIPFIPIRCEKPTGPLDEPTFPDKEPPPGFWEDSAEMVFKPARDIVDLIEICQSRDKMPMSALVLFAIWTAAFVGIVAWHFPKMDVKGHMVDKSVNSSEADVRDTGPTGTTFATLKKMSHWLKMACTYVTYFQDMDKYYEQVKYDYGRHVKKNSFLVGTAGEDKLSIRLGGRGGGLEEWGDQKGKIVNHGAIMAEDEGHGDEREDSGASASERGPSMGPDRHSGFGGDSVKTPRSTPMSFTAINNQSLASAAMAASDAADRMDGLPEGSWNERYGMQQQHVYVSPDAQDVPVYYESAAGVLGYVDRNEGMRWADTGPAGGLEPFSHGDSDGPAVWAEQKGGAFFEPRHGYDTEELRTS
jgi:hypothetical protein